MAGARDPSTELTTVDRATSDADATEWRLVKKMTGSEMVVKRLVLGSLSHLYPFVYSK